MFPGKKTRRLMRKLVKSRQLARVFRLITWPIFIAVCEFQFMSVLIVLSMLLSFSASGQESITDSIVNFSSDCSDAISPDDPSISEFKLLAYHSTENSTHISFEIIANCAQVNKGVLFVDSDTLIIEDTDAKLIEREVRWELDSSGNETIVTEETSVTSIAFCDCLVTFIYDLSTSLHSLKYLKFHERIFEVSKKE